MQDGVGEVEQALSGMGRLKKLMLGVSHGVSLRWHSVVVMNYQCLSAECVIVTCGSKCQFQVLCVYVSKWRSYSWECGLM